MWDTCNPTQHYYSEAKRPRPRWCRPVQRGQTPTPAPARISGACTVLHHRGQAQSFKAILERLCLHLYMFLRSSKTNLIL